MLCVGGLRTRGWRSGFDVARGLRDCSVLEAFVFGASRERFIVSAMCF